MRRTPDIGGTANANGAAAASRTKAPAPDLNGSEASELRELLHALQAMRVGDFSVRMAGDQVGLMGKIADTFNEIVAANQRMAQAARARRPGRRPRRQDPPARASSASPTAPGARWKPRSTR